MAEIGRRRHVTGDVIGGHEEGVAGERDVTQTAAEGRGGDVAGVREQSGQVADTGHGDQPPAR